METIKTDKLADAIRHCVLGDDAGERTCGEQVVAAVVGETSPIITVDSRGNITQPSGTTVALGRDPVAPSATDGAMRKKRGVKPDVPDVLVWYRGKSITIELKSRRGQCSRSRRLARERLLGAGPQWWLARSARAAM
jgi:hypothetical protein